jgi:REP element-mobilizing transposase RayT
MVNENQMRSRQLSFLKEMKASIQLNHGGELGKGKRKSRRPFDPKRPLHVVMRSSRAQGRWSMLSSKNQRRVKTLIQETAAKHGIQLFHFANVGSHLHFLFRARRVEGLRAFMREVSGQIAFQITGSRKTSPLQGKFWDHLPYSRVVSWGNDFKAVTRYVIGNLFQAAGGWNKKRDPHLKVVLLSMREAGVGPPA